MEVLVIIGINLIGVIIDDMLFGKKRAKETIDNMYLEILKGGSR